MRFREKAAGLIKKWRLISAEFENFRGRRYPEFVTSGRPASARLDGVPVFMMHTAHQEVFSSQLEHLHRNGYRTLDCEEMFAFICGGKTLKDPSVMLTFDDGEQSLYDIAFPLLKKYRMKAVNFLVSGRVRHGDSNPVPTGSKNWLTWDQVQEMSNSGHVDFQSHTLWHETMFISDTPLDFMRPGIFTDGLLVDRPLVRVGGEQKLIIDWGTPLYAHAPRMTDHRKFHDREDLRGACVDYVRKHGGVDFFNRAGWKKNLMQVWRNACGDTPAGTYETSEEQFRAILSSLSNSKKLLEEKTGRSIRHLAYPWATGGNLAERASVEAGYVTNYHGPLAGTPINRPGQNPLRIARIKDDYIERLPGRGRISLATVFARKFIRRAGNADIY